MKFLKWLLIAVVVLVAAGAVGILFFLNPAAEKLRPVIVQKLSESLKTPVEIGGISASVFPKTELKLTSVSLAGEKGVSVGTFFVDMSVGEILGGNLSLQNVRLENPQIFVRRSADGVIHIGEMKFGGEKEKKEKAGSEKEPSAKASPEKASIEKSSSSPPLQIKNISVTGGEVQYHDEALPKPLDLTVKDLSVAIRGFDMKAWFPVEIAATILGRSAKNIRIAGELGIEDLLKGHPPAKLKISASDMDLASLGSLVAAFVEKSGRLELAGTGSFEADIAPKGDELLATGDVDLTGAAIGFTPTGSDKVVEKAEGIALRLSSTKRLLRDVTVVIDAFDAKLGGSVLSGAATIHPGGTEPVKLSMKEFDLSDIAKFVHIPVELTGKLSGVASFDPAKKPVQQAVEGNFELSSISVRKPDSQLSLEGIGGKVRFSPGSITAEKLGLSTKGERFEFEGNLATFLEGNRVRVAPEKINAFGGIIKPTIEAGLNEPRPFTGRVQANGLDLKRVVSFTGNTSKWGLTGTLESLTTAFDGNAADINRSLNANFSFAAAKGEIVGANIFGMIFHQLGAIPGLSGSLAALLPENYKPLVQAVDATKFDTLTLGGQLSSGTNIALRQSELRNAAFLLGGSGTLTTFGQLNMKTQMKLTAAVTEGMVARSDKLRLLLDRENNLTFPVVITKDDGPLLVLPDVSELGKNALRGGAKDAATKALEKVAPGLGGATKLLDKLF